MQTQQIASSRLRALETGRWVVQAAPTGFSAFVTPDGEVLDRTAVGERAVIRRAVELRSGETWYTRLGDGPVIAILAAGLAATCWLARGDEHLAPSAATSPRQRSRSTVTGPSLTSETCMAARNLPVATVAPNERSVPTTCSTSGSACSGRAAAVQLGRRPPVVSP